MPNDYISVVNAARKDLGNAINAYQERNFDRIDWPALRNHVPHLYQTRAESVTHDDDQSEYVYEYERKLARLKTAVGKREALVQFALEDLGDYDLKPAHLKQIKAEIPELEKEIFDPDWQKKYLFPNDPPV